MSDIFSNITGSVSNWLNQQTHPIYNALGREIGYYDTLQNLAAGIIFIYDGEKNVAATDWHIKCGLLSVVTPATDCLLQAGLTPIWATKAQVDKQKAAVAPATSLIPGLSDVQLPSLNVPQLTLPNLTPYLIVGGIAIVGVIILARHHSES